MNVLQYFASYMEQHLMKVIASLLYGKCGRVHDFLAVKVDENRKTHWH